VRIGLLALLLLLLPLMAAGAQPHLRPLAGIGFIGPQSFLHDISPEQLVLYREPGIGRLPEHDITEFPLLNQANNSTIPGIRLAVTGRKGEWVRVIYDDAGREGWITPPRHWGYHPWDRFLKGREVRLLSGLKKELYLLRPEPDPDTRASVTIERRQRMRVIEVMGDWMLVVIDLSGTGWLRWKDDDGRLLIEVE
jgi:hypothetical protein